MTLREWLDRGTALLGEGPHADRARRDAETLLQHHIGKNKAWLIAHANDEFAGCTAIGYAALIERRKKGAPLQYITGETEFYRMPFRVTPDVLIPRPETEHLVETIAHFIPTFDRRAKKFFEIKRLHPAYEGGVRISREGNPNESGWPPRILDVGTGSGCIPISIAHDWGGLVDITAIDISEPALAIARFNANRLGFADHIRFLHGDLLAPVAGEKFEIIASNPPYVPESDRNSLAVEVRDHEPALALFAAGDGLAIYRRLIPDAFAALVPGGYLVLEIGYGQQQAIEDLLSSAHFTNVAFTSDLQGIPRVASAQRP